MLLFFISVPSPRSYHIKIFFLELFSCLCSIPWSIHLSWPFSLITCFSLLIFIMCSFLLFGTLLIHINPSVVNYNLMCFFSEIYLSRSLSSSYLTTFLALIPVLLLFWFQTENKLLLLQSSSGPTRRQTFVPLDKGQLRQARQHYSRVWLDLPLI